MADPAPLQGLAAWLRAFSAPPTAAADGRMLRRWADEVDADSRAQEAPAPGYEKMRGGKPVSFWRDDALEQSAQIAERYGADPWAARDIRAMKSPLPAAPEQQEKPT